MAIEDTQVMVEELQILWDCKIVKLIIQNFGTQLK